MSPRPLLHLALALLGPELFAAGTISFQLYALDASQADRLPPEVAESAVTLAAHLTKMKEEGTATLALEFGGPFKWSTPVGFSKGDEFEYTSTFTSEAEELKSGELAAKFLGYQASLRALSEKDGSARLQITFTWTPTYQKIEIPGGGDAGWVPKFHTVKADISSSAPPAKPFVAATWRTTLALAEGGKPAPRQLYLLVTWTADPAK